MSGNRYTKSPQVTRKTPTRSLRWPPERLRRFDEAAKAEGLSFSAWALAGLDSWLEGSMARRRAIKAAQAGKLKADK